MSPVALSTSTISWRDQASTDPIGRLQGDVKFYYYGGVEGRVNPEGLLGPDGQPLCGTSLRLCNLSLDGPDPDPTKPVTGVIDPPAAYTNPLRMSKAGCLWIDPNEIVTNRYKPSVVATPYPAVGVIGPSGIRELGPAMTNCVKNTTAGPALLTQEISVLNASISAPPPSQGGGAKIDFVVALPNYHVPNISVSGSTGTPSGDATPLGQGTASLTHNQIEGASDSRSAVSLFLEIDGTSSFHVLGCATLGFAITTITFKINPIYLNPGESHTTTIQPKIQPWIEPVGAYTASPGIVTSLMRLEPLPPGGAFIDSPGCS